MKLIYHKPGCNSGLSTFATTLKEIGSGSRVCLVSPYIGLNLLFDIINDASEWWLITDYNEWLRACPSKRRGDIVKFAKKFHDNVHHCPNVHAKVVIGDSLSLIGSANLTAKGLSRRDEMALLISEASLIDELRLWFDSLWSKTKPVSVRQLIALAAELPDKNKIAVKTKLASNYKGIKTELPKYIHYDAKQEIAQIHNNEHADYSVIMGNLPDNVRALVMKQSEIAQNYFYKLAVLLQHDNLMPWHTNAHPECGGDIRYGYNPPIDGKKGRGIYAEIWFPENALIKVKLYAEHMSIRDPEIHWVTGDSKRGKYEIDNMEYTDTIPEKYAKWIAHAKKYIIELIKK